MQTSKANKTTRVLSATQIKRVLTGFARRISEEHGASGSLAFIGIRTRGPTLARRVAATLQEKHGLPVPVGELDITLYRDDLNTLLPKGRIDATHIPFEITDRILILFDDVLHTGRTVRAAVDHLVALGRPGPSSWPCWWTGAAGSFPSRRASWARRWTFRKAATCV